MPSNELRNVSRLSRDSLALVPACGVYPRDDRGAESGNRLRSRRSIWFSVDVTAYRGDAWSTHKRNADQQTGGAEADQLAFSEDQLWSASFVLNVVAIPVETLMVRLAESLGKTVISGTEVIVLQAFEQLVLYTGMRPDTVLIEKAATFARSPVF